MRLSPTRPADIIRGMGRDAHYPNAPITEAIIDLRVELPGDVSATQLLNAHRGQDAAYPHECSYVAVPPNRTFPVKTRYVFNGRGSPLPLGEE